MATNFKLQEFELLAERNIFVDANVLIYLFWSTGQYSYEENYSRVFKNLQKQGNTLYVDFLVISEVINRVLRIEHKKFHSHLNYKDFRNSQDGKDVISDIYLIVKEDILKHFKIIGKSFDKNDIESFLLLNQLDFVDKAIRLICSENNFVLLTNDRDFKNSELDILTGNPNILN